MDNGCSEGTQERSVTSPKGEALGRDVHTRHSECNKEKPQRFDPGSGDAREWNNDTVAILVLIIQSRYYVSNIDIDEIISLLDDLGAKYCMYNPLIFHMRESYAIRSHIHDNDNPKFMEANNTISGDRVEGY